jgi:hypothetical protein
MKVQHTTFALAIAGVEVQAIIFCSLLGSSSGLKKLY